MKKMDDRQILEILAQAGYESELSEDDDWPEPSLSPVQDLFPEAVVTEDDTENDTQVDDIESSIDTSNTSLLSPSTSLQGTSHSPEPTTSRGSRRSATTRPHLFTRNTNFNREFTVAGASAVMQPTVLSPVEYFLAYLSDDVWDALTLETQKKYMSRTGRNLALTVMEMKRYVEMSFMMSVLQFPRLNMYWQERTKINLIVENMSRARFELIRSNLKLVDDCKVSPVLKKQDKVWKVQPLLNSVMESLICGDVGYQTAEGPEGSTDSDDYKPRKRMHPILPYPQRVQHALHMPELLPKYSERHRCRSNIDRCAVHKQIRDIRQVDYSFCKCFSEARSEQFQKKQQDSSSSTKEQDEEWTLEVDYPKNYLCVKRRMPSKCSETGRPFANVKNID
ncbi:hypothetical protein Pmani_026324 [Petrolisthes manimaculis]|uniref:PiggyBac transposable element-derived protein domain-containing protein n=1 Tax=Petrolisthes manimaculis TaxID=1843537 RepID=A0AAE1P5E5_9EUCA|nr:hypothetical protein Pmani_026324 [Petrolisthes manimaculis]